MSETWWDFAKCRGVDPDLFFPDKVPGALAKARAVCHGCLVRNSCLDEALENREEHGIWGGTTPEERRKILRAAGQLGAAV